MADKGIVTKDKSQKPTMFDIYIGLAIKSIKKEAVASDVERKYLIRDAKKLQENYAKLHQTKWDDTVVCLSCGTRQPSPKYIEWCENCFSIYLDIDGDEATEGTVHLITYKNHNAERQQNKYFFCH